MSTSTSHPELIYCIDADDFLICVNDAWHEFARANAAPELTGEGLINTRLWYFIDDAQVRHLYRLMLQRVRTGGKGLILPFRCDSPEYRRFMELDIRLQDHLIRFESRTLRVERREAVSLLDAQADHSGEFVTVCSWCKRVLVEGEGWREVEEAIRALRLFDSVKLPQLTHGICPECLETFRARLQSQQSQGSRGAGGGGIKS